MPNDCHNSIVIIGHEEDLDIFETNHLRFSYFVPVPPGLTPDERFEWRCENWGTKWDNPTKEESEPYGTRVIHRSKNELRMYVWTAWAPPIPFLSTLLDRYPRCWIKNTWDEEGGMAGVWVSHMNKGNQVIKELSWLEPEARLTVKGTIHIPEE